MHRPLEPVLNPWLGSHTQAAAWAPPTPSVVCPGLQGVHRGEALLVAENVPMGQGTHNDKVASSLAKPGPHRHAVSGSEPAPAPSERMPGGHAMQVRPSGEGYW